MKIVAEISANHKGSLQTALDTISAARDCGADYVKIQTYEPERMTLDIDNEDFVVPFGEWKGRKLFSLYSEGMTPRVWHDALFDHAAKNNIKLFSTPFSPEDVHFLEQFDPPYYKIASFEITDLSLIAAAAATGKPLIISTGMADAEDIIDALAAAHYATSVTLLHCVSRYPTDPKDAALWRVDWLRRFERPVGLSDHSMSFVIPIVAGAMKCAMLEKHFTFVADSLDAGFSFWPNQFKIMVDQLKEVEVLTSPQIKMLGEETDRSKVEPMFFMRRSLYVVRDIAEGEMITHANVQAIRPGYGERPKHLAHMIGRRANRKLDRGTPMRLEYVHPAWIDRASQP